MADKRISQLVDRGTVANNDVVPIVVSGATTTNKATISSIQTFMQGNLDLGVTSVGITLGSSGTDVSVSGSPITSSGNITINLPTASATNRGLLSAADWTTFNNKANAGNYVTLDTTQTITAQKTFTTSGSSDTMIISHGSGSGFALDVLKAGNGEAIRVTKSSGSGNAMTISGGNFEAGTIVKTGGTSSQFLKADGSVDSSTYLTTASAGTTYVPYTGAGANVDLGIYNLTANAVNVNASGSNAGVINLESNTIFSLVNGYGTIGSGTTNQFNLYQTTGAGVFRGAILSLNSITASATRTFTLPDADGTLALTSQIPANPVGGTGAAGRVAYWNGSGTITSDSLFQWNDTFRRLGIGCTPTVSLDVVGAGVFTTSLTSQQSNISADGAGVVLQGYVDNSLRIAVRGSGYNSGARGGLLASTGDFSGALNGTSASFTGSITSTGGFLQFANNYGVEGRNAANSAYRSVLKLNASNQIEIGRDTDISAIILGTASANNALTLSSTGAATFSGSLTVTGNSALGGTHTASYPLHVQKSVSNNYVAGIFNTNTTAGTSYGLFMNAGTNGTDRAIQVNNAANTLELFRVFGNGNTDIFGTLGVTGAATFSSSVGIGGGVPSIFTGYSVATFGSLSTTNNGITIASTTTGSGFIEFADGSGGGTASYRGYIQYAHTDDAMILASTGTERMRITSGGGILFGTTNGAANAGEGVKINASVGKGFLAVVADSSVPDTFDYYNSTAAAYRFYVTNAGTIYATNTSISAISDARLKENIQDLTGGLDAIMSLKPKVFDWKSESGNEGKGVRGFIAQEVEEVFPEYVNEYKSDTIPEDGIPYKSVRQDFIPFLVKAMQEQQEQIKELQIQIDSLKNQIK